MEKILLVEDDETIANNLKYYLESENFIVETVQTAKETYKKLEEKEYEVILLDVTLKGKDNGFEMYKTIEKKSNAGVIFLTALDEEENIVNGLEMGAEDYVTKPFHAKELLSRINKVINRKKKESKITIQKVTLNKTTGKVYKEEKEIELTGLEYKILKMLFENRGNIVTREKILEDIWDSQESFVNDNTLTVYIKRIRQKIEKDASKPDIIKTVKGVGYRIKK